MRTALAVTLMLAVLSGCSQPHEAVDPSDPPVEPMTTTGPSGQPVAPPWTGVYAGRLYGYGFIGPDDEGYGPLLPGIAVDGQGQVLAFQVAYLVEDRTAPRLDLTAADERWRTALEDTLARGTIYPDAGPQKLRVRDIESRQLSEGDWQRVHSVFEDALSAAREPRANQGAQVADGGATFLGAGGQRVTLDDNHDRGGGWETVDDELGRLQSWVDGSGSP